MKRYHAVDGIVHRPIGDCFWIREFVHELCKLDCKRISAAGGGINAHNGVHCA